MFRAGWEEAAVVDADLFVDQPVEECVHSKDRVLGRARIDGQVVRLVRVGLQVEQLEVVAGGQFLERLGTVVLDGGEVPAELVPAVEDAADRTPLGEVELRR